MVVQKIYQSIDSEDRFLKADRKLQSLKLQGKNQSNFRMSSKTHAVLMLTLTFLISGATPMNETDFLDPKKHHPMSFAWSLQPLMGLCGTLLNSFFLFMQYGERQTFIRPVNAMIWYVSLCVMCLMSKLKFFPDLGWKPRTDLLYQHLRCHGRLTLCQPINTFFPIF